MLGVDRFAAVITDNTESMVTMRTELRLLFPLLIMVKCCVHVLDLLCESYAKIPGVASALADAKTLVSFAKANNSQLYELYLKLHKAAEPKPVSLRFFPDTRFSYAYLMIESVVANRVVLLQMIEHDIFVEARALLANPAGRKKMDDCAALIGNNALWTRLRTALLVLRPVSSVIKYLGGDSVPISHVYPCYQALVDDWKQLKESEIDTVLGTGTYMAMKAALDLRWKGNPSTRHIGLYDFELLAAFALDPTLSFDPAFKHLHEGTAVSDAVNDYLEREAAGDETRMRQLKHSHDLFLVGTQKPYDELHAFAAISSAQPRGTMSVTNLITYLATLKATFLINTYAAFVKKVTRAKLDKSFFAESCLKLLSVRPHACAIERANKSHRFLHDKLRVRLGEAKVHMLIYTYHNLRLVHGPSANILDSPDFETFLLGMVDEEDVDTVKEILLEVSWEELALLTPAAPVPGPAAAAVPEEEEEEYGSVDIVPPRAMLLITRLLRLTGRLWAASLFTSGQTLRCGMSGK